MQLDSVQTPLDTATQTGSAQGNGTDAIEHFDGSGAGGRYSDDNQLGWIELTQAGLEDRSHNDYLRRNIGDGNGFLTASEIDQAIDMLLVAVDADSGTMAMTEHGIEAAESGLSPEEFAASQSNEALPSTEDELLQDQGTLSRLVGEAIENPDTLMRVVTPALKDYVISNYGESFSPQELAMATADDAQLHDVLAPLLPNAEDKAHYLIMATSDDTTPADILMPLFEANNREDFLAASHWSASPIELFKPLYSPEQFSIASSDDATLADVFAPFYSDDQMQAATAEDASITDILTPFYTPGGLEAALSPDATLTTVFNPIYDREQELTLNYEPNSKPVDLLDPFLNYGNHEAVAQSDGSFGGVLEAILS